MARKPNVIPTWEEVTFQEEGLEARFLITRTDKKGIITFASKAYSDMTKYDKEEFIGSPHNIVRHPFMPETVFKNMWDTIKRGVHWEGLVMNLRKDGKHYWVLVKIDPINSKGQFVSNKPSEVAGYFAIRQEPTRNSIEKAYEKYKELRIKELKDNIDNLKYWEKELLEKLTNEK